MLDPDPYPDPRIRIKSMRIRNPDKFGVNFCRGELAAAVPGEGGGR
jgi:hypothetical protein